MVQNKMSAKSPLGRSSDLRLSFVDSDLGIPGLLLICYDHPAKFPLAQAESGKRSNISVIGTQNLGLRADG